MPGAWRSRVQRQLALGQVPGVDPLSACAFRSSAIEGTVRMQNDRFRQIRTLGTLVALAVVGGCGGDSAGSFGPADRHPRPEHVVSETERILSTAPQDTLAESRSLLRWAHALSSSPGRWSFGDPGTTPSGQILQRTADVALTRDGRVLVLDSRAGQVLELSATGEVLERVGSPGEGPGEFLSPTSVAFANDGALVVGDGGRRIQAFQKRAGEYELVGYRVLGFPFAGLCFEGDRLVAQSRSQAELAGVRVLEGHVDSEDGVPSFDSFGVFYDHSDPVLQLYYQRHVVACLGDGSVALGSRYLQSVRTYALDATPVLEIRFEGFGRQHFRLRQPGSVSVIAADAHRDPPFVLRALTAIEGSSVLIAQLAPVRGDPDGEVEPEGREIATFLIDLEAEEPYFVGRLAEVVVAAVDHGDAVEFVTVRSVPFPRVTKHRVTAGELPRAWEGR